jgi:hypothetical protein
VVHAGLDVQTTVPAALYAAGRNDTAQVTVHRVRNEALRPLATCSEKGLFASGTPLCSMKPSGESVVLLLRFGERPKGDIPLDDDLTVDDFELSLEDERVVPNVAVAVLGPAHHAVQSNVPC